MRPAYYPVRYKFFFTLLFVFPGLTLFSQAPCLPVALQCEYLVNPLGLDAANPRLSWKLKDERMNAKQTAWQIFIGTDSLAISKGIGRSWQTGRINSSDQLTIYKGKALSPFTRYFWAVRVWDKDGKSGSLSTVNSFETGMMDKKNWKGAWISDTRDITIKQAPYFRKSFSSNKKIKSARCKCC